MKKEIPILFSSSMVLAILEGRKTMTRRTIKDIHPDSKFLSDLSVSAYHFIEPHQFNKHDSQKMASRVYCPYGQIGNVLWVRETFKITAFNADKGTLSGYYLADGKSFYDIELTENEWNKFEKWQKKLGVKSSLFLFKSISRIWLERTATKVERINDITNDDALLEGIEVRSHIEDGKEYTVYRDYGFKERFASGAGFKPKNSFFSLWQKINDIESLRSNPWLWVVSFKVLSTNGKPEEKHQHFNFTSRNNLETSYY